MKQRTGNLPAEDKSFVGRQQEVAASKRLLSQARLLTITGPPGVGKSRVGLRVATQVQRRFPDGVWLVSLGDLDDGALVPHTVMDALGVGGWSLRQPIDALSEYLESRRSLLVLDDCEHLVPDCATLVNALLRNAPGLRVMLTSRHLLGVGGEHVMTIPPLPTAESAHRPLPLQEVLDCPSVQLFDERARDLVPDFTVDAANCDAVARICRKMEGLPLAIELAAKWLRTMSLEQILVGLDTWPVSPEAGVDQPGRHGTLRTSFDWSFELCSPAERSLWARSSVFAGSFDLEAAEAVCADERILAEDVLGLVVGLVDKSVLSTLVDHGGHMRYRLLDPTRQYGAQRLDESGKADLLRRRHRDYYRRLAERAEVNWVGPQQAAWHERMHCEHANLRTALDFCLTHPGQRQAGLGLAGALWFCWVGGGWVTEGRYWLDHLLALATKPERQRAKALWASAWITTLQGDADRALLMLDEARELALNLGEDDELTSALCVSGYAEHMRDDQQRAVKYLEEALELEGTSGRPSAVTVVSRPILASTLLLLGDCARARALCNECLEMHGPFGAPWSRSWALWVLGVAAWTEGDPQQASFYARECLRVKQHLNDLVGVALSLELLAWSSSDQNAERTARLLGAGHALWRQIGRPLFGFAPYVNRHQVSEQHARKILGPQAFDTAFQKGHDLTLYQAMSYALQESEDPVA